jgi:hypothetical protein
MMHVALVQDAHSSLLYLPVILARYAQEDAQVSEVQNRMLWLSSPPQYQKRLPAIYNTPSGGSSIEDMFT